MASEVEASTFKEMKLTGLNMFGYYEPKSQNKTCEICRKSLLDISENLQKNTVLTNSISSSPNILIGKCDHGFHKSCMEQWKKSGRE